MGRLSDHLNGDPDWDRLRQAQVNVATTDPLVDWVDTDDLNGKMNGLHYDRDGYKKLGTAFAEKAVKQLRRE